MIAPVKATQSAKRIGFYACFALMVACVLTQGAYFFVRDALTSDLPFGFVISDCVCVLLALSLVVYWVTPLVTLIVGWFSFGTVAFALERYTDEHSLVWFLARHSLLIGFVLASHVGYLLRWALKAKNS